MNLMRIIYASTASNNMDKEMVLSIVKSANKNNSSLNLSGFLCINQNYFLQCIEGSKTKINEIYHKIAKDERHHNLVILDYSEIDHRDFEKWSMGLHLNAISKREIFLKYSHTGDFNPYELSGKSALLFLKEVSKLEL